MSMTYLPSSALRPSLSLHNLASVTFTEVLVPSIQPPPSHQVTSGYYLVYSLAQDTQYTDHVLQLLYTLTYMTWYSFHYTAPHSYQVAIGCIMEN